MDDDGRGHLSSRGDPLSAAKHTTALMQAALQGAGTCVWEWHIDSDRLSDIDEGFRLLGYVRPPRGNTQADWDALIHPDDREANHAAYLRHECGEVDTYEHSYRARHANGSWRWLNERGRIVERDADGRPLRMLGTQTDITEHRALEAEASHAREQALAAAAANQAKTEFLSRMSHELRTPLNAVLGFAQLMEVDQQDAPSDGQRRRLKLIRDAGAHLLQMIGDMLDLTRIEAGGMALTLETVPLRTAAEEALAMLREMADRAKVQIELNEDLSATARTAPMPAALADRTRLRQVLLNLISNAIKYNRPGGQVQLQVWATPDGLVHASVADNGLGISEAELHNVFEPFHRGGQAGSAVDGSGIGLSVTQALVSLMKGRITVTSQEGKGSTFTVTLPAARG